MRRRVCTGDFYSYMIIILRLVFLALKEVSHLYNEDAIGVGDENNIMK